jgi:hypothetical protein
VHGVDLGVRAQPGVVQDHRRHGPDLVEQTGALSRLPGPHEPDAQRHPAGQRRRDLRQRRQLEQDEGRRRLLRQAVRPAPPPVDDRRRVDGVEVHRPAVELRHVDQVELERGHDARGTLSAAEGEVQVGVFRRGHPPEDAVAGDDFERAHAVGVDAAGAGQRADTAAGRVADDADVRRGAVDPGQAVGRHRGDQLRPLDAGAHAGPALGVHGDLVEAAGDDEQVTREGALRAVAGGLHAGGEAVPPGEAHGRGDVLSGGDRDDGGGPHRYGEVPRRDECVVLGLVGGVQRAGQLGAQGIERHVGDYVERDVEGEGHGVLQVGSD